MKCPCCGIPVIVDDLRPIIHDIVIQPQIQHKIRFQKLHRSRNCFAPYIPIPTQTKHSNIHFVPSVGDYDSKYTRFNYIDCTMYETLLINNQMEIQNEITSCIDNAEKTYLGMALDFVLTQQNQIQFLEEEEKTLQERYSNPSTGMYQPQSPALVYHHHHEEEEDHHKDDNDDYLNNHDVGDEVVDGGGNKTDNIIPPHPSSPVQQGRRFRGDSISSYKSVDTVATPSSRQSNFDDDDAYYPLSPGSPTTINKPNSNAKSHHGRRRPPTGGTMYLDETNEVHFYQSEDGQLIFLNGFNMTCLSSDYNKGPSTTTDDHDDANNEKNDDEVNNKDDESSETTFS